MYRNRKNEENYQKYSKLKLVKSIDTKLNTTMIGAISAFEEEFGELWGHGLDETELSETHKAVRKRWLDARCKILNKGNSQRRKLSSELESYSVRYNGYTLNMLIERG